MLIFILKREREGENERERMKERERERIRDIERERKNKRHRERERIRDKQRERERDKILINPGQKYPQDPEGSGYSPWFRKVIMAWDSGNQTGNRKQRGT
jgi:hypothetical protein